MFRRSGRKLRGPSWVILLLVGFTVPLPADAQGFVNAIPSQARVFPDISSGVTAMKCDSAGHYYILATPANVIWIFDRDGKRIGQIPRVGAETAKIQYAVDFDLDKSGRLFVADRAANAVKVFSPDGSLLASIPVFAPTGVVALPDDRFAVSTLRPKRLIEIRTLQGKLVRSFGDPADAGADPESKQLQSLGKVFGDGAGDIYFAFTALPDPTIRKYDRFGYAASDATFDVERFQPSSAPSPDDRVQFGLSYRETSFADSYNTWAAVGDKGDIFFGGGLTPGLGARKGEDPATSQSVTSNILSTGLASGSGREAGGGTISAQGSIQGDSLQFHAGGNAQHQGATGKPAGSSASSGSSESIKPSQNLPNGAALQYNAQDSSGDFLGMDDSVDGFQNFLSVPQPPGLGPDEGSSSLGVIGSGLGGFGGLGLFGGLGGQGYSSGLGGFGHGGGAGLGERHGEGGPHGEFGRGPGEPRYGGHGRFGQGFYNLTGTVKVNLDPVAPDSNEKLAITALGVDPASKEMWAGIGRLLAHFDKNGEFLGDCFIATPDGALVRATAIIVQPDRLIVASDSHGIYEFARRQGSTPQTSAQGSTVNQQPSQESLPQH